MKSIDIKIEMLRKEVNGVQIAQRAGCSKQHISLIINGRRRNPRIEEVIAAAIDKPVEEVFPETKEAA